MEDVPNDQASILGSYEGHLAAIKALMKVSDRIHGEIERIDEVRKKVVAAIRRLHGSVESLDILLIQARENPLDEAAVNAILREGVAAVEEARALLEAEP